jgi:hypothetical protein
MRASSEVLTALAPQTRDFLLRTSVLGRFTPDLCDAVLGREDSAAVLPELAGSNMFLVALDANGDWYRYHHLFGELLHGGEAAAAPRRRAAAWCRAHGLVEDAIEYAAAAGDAETVAELLVEHDREFIWGDGWRSYWAGCAGSPRAAAGASFAAGSRGVCLGAARAPRGRRSAPACGGGARAAGAPGAVAAVR